MQLSVRPKWFILSDLEELETSAAVIITRPPEIVTCIKFLVSEMTIFLIFDSHPRPSHPDGAAFILGRSSDDIVHHLDKLLLFDARLMADKHMQWETQLLGQYSGHFFVRRLEEVKQLVASTQDALLASLAKLETRAQISDLKNRNAGLQAELDRLKLEGDIMRGLRREAEDLRSKCSQLSSENGTLHSKVAAVDKLTEENNDLRCAIEQKNGSVTPSRLWKGSPFTGGWSYNGRSSSSSADPSRKSQPEDPEKPPQNESPLLPDMSSNDVVSTANSQEESHSLETITEGQGPRDPLQQLSGSQEVAITGAGLSDDSRQSGHLTSGSADDTSLQDASPHSSPSLEAIADASFALHASGSPDAIIANADSADELEYLSDSAEDIGVETADGMHHPSGAPEASVMAAGPPNDLQDLGDSPKEYSPDDLPHSGGSTQASSVDGKLPDDAPISDQHTRVVAKSEHGEDGEALAYPSPPRMRAVADSFPSASHGESAEDKLQADEHPQAPQLPRQDIGEDKRSRAEPQQHGTRPQRKSTLSRFVHAILPSKADAQAPRRVGTQPASLLPHRLGKSSRPKAEEEQIDDRKSASPPRRSQATPFSSGDEVFSQQLDPALVTVSQREDMWELAEQQLLAAALSLSLSGQPNHPSPPTRSGDAMSHAEWQPFPEDDFERALRLQAEFDDEDLALREQHMRLASAYDHALNGQHERHQKSLTPPLTTPSKALNGAAGSPELLSGASGDHKHALRLQSEFDTEHARIHQEHHELSTSTQPEFDCGICLDTHSEDHVAILESCGHKYCRSCMREYVSTKLKEHRFPMFCPTCLATKTLMEPVCQLSIDS
jgi:hypothetical protein